MESTKRKPCKFPNIYRAGNFIGILVLDKFIGCGYFSLLSTLFRFYSYRNTFSSNFPTVQLSLSPCSLCTSPLNKSDHTFGLLSADLRNSPHTLHSCLWSVCCRLDCWMWTVQKGVFESEIEVRICVDLSGAGIDNCTVVQRWPVSVVRFVKTVLMCS
jgi:hypothetical protein